MIERIKLDGLVAARFFAALMVVLFHLVAMPNPDLQIPPSLSFIRNHLAIGVPLFFAISAFSLYVGYFSALSRGEHLRKYFIRRFFRIAPLFYFMTALLAMYLGFLPPLDLLLTSLTFTFNLVPQHAAGFVSASWSIGIEMVFYAILPVLVFAVSSVRTAIAFFALAGFLGVLWQQAFVGIEGMANFAAYFIIPHLVYFAAGILAYFLWLPIKGQKAIGLVILAVGVIAFVATIYHRGLLWGLLGPGLLNVVQSIPLMLCIIGIAIAPVRILVNPFTKAMGETSFSLYLLHPMIINDLIWRGGYKWVYSMVADPWSAFAICAAMTLVPLFILSLITYRLIEAPGSRLGNWVISRGGRHAGNPSRIEMSTESLATITLQPKI